MAANEGPNEEEIMAKKNEAYNAVTYFEVARRKVYHHCRMEIPEDVCPVSKTATRREGVWYVLLTSTCQHCHAHHTCLSRESYLQWYARLPFECDHKGVVSNMQVEPDEQEALKYPQTFMPAQLKRLDPEGITESSGGITTLEKLHRDHRRLQATFGNAMNMLGDLLNFSRHPNIDTVRHPELDTSDIYVQSDDQTHCFS